MPNPSSDERLDRTGRKCQAGSIKYMSSKYFIDHCGMKQRDNLEGIKKRSSPKHEGVINIKLIQLN